MRAGSSELPSHTFEAGRVETLDLLRLFAVAVVVLFHFGFHGPTGPAQTYVAVPQFDGFARYGYLGVQLFFVISGFVIAYSAMGRSVSQFAIARISRLYPAFLFCMTLSFLVTLVFGSAYFEVTPRQWLANLTVAAPAWHQPYVDSVYWTLIIEMIFYAWIGVLIATGLFPKHIVKVVVGWLLVSLLNEAWIGSYVLRKILLTDQSGFFSCGVLLFEICRGRRGAGIQLLFGAAAMIAVAQAVKNVEGWRVMTGQSFDGVTVGVLSICILALAIVAVRIGRLPLPSGLVMALGGLTYPAYLLNQMIGYVAFLHLRAFVPAVPLFALIVCGIGVLSWLIWKYVDRPGQRFMRTMLTRLFEKATHLAGRSRPLAPASN
ncbi:MAG: acyltransferase [Afipia sp.]|nr:acyltransferase [Afipia sp.]OJW66323.1 MAG: hypothetical protein BGO65_03710 [Afipia sp. 64-13]